MTRRGSWGLATTMTTNDHILSILSLAAGPQTTKAVWQALRQHGLTLREDQVGAELQHMFAAGLVQRQGAGWRALKAESPGGQPTRGSLPWPLKLDASTSPVPATHRVPSPIQPPVGPPSAPAGRWGTFRRLCAYYVGCLLQDDAPSLRGYMDRLNDTWISIRQPIPWPRLAQTGYGFTLALTGDARRIQRNRAKQGEDLSVFLGYPVEVIRPNGKDPWIIPVFAQPMSADWAAESMTLTPDGPIIVNSAWLESTFRTNPERVAFTNIVGLTSEVDDADEDEDQPRLAEPPADFSALAARAAGYLHDRVVGRITPETVDTSDSWEDVPAGIVNRAVLMLGPRVPYTRTLIRELRKLTKWPDEDLDRTALAVFFPHDLPHGEGPSCPLAEYPAGMPPRAVIQHKIFNDPQRHAVVGALRAPASVITGPPGSGKSEVVRAILINQAVRERTTLFASKNHRALDAVVPALNAMVESGPLIIRASAQDLALRHSWKATLRDLLARPHTDDSGASAELLVELARALAQVNRVLDDWATRFSMDEEYAACSGRLEEVRRDLPAAVRPDEQISRWPPSITPAIVAGWRIEHEHLIRVPHGPLARLWHWLRRSARQRAAQNLTARLAGLPALENIRFTSKPADQGSTRADEQFAIWHAWAAAWDALRICRGAEESVRLLPAATALSADLQAATNRSKDLALTVLDRLAGGRGVALSPQTRQDLNNLRAGIANLGERRWAKQFREHFPTILKAFPLWAVSNLSVGSSLPLTPGAFDLAVIDEASQCDIASSIPILARARRAVIVGDPRQLTHVTRLSQSAERQQLEAHGLTDIDVQRFSYRENSCFDLANGNSLIEDRTLLRQHYRCHPEIAQYANTAFYRGSLEVVTATDRLRIPPGVRPGLNWTHVAGEVEPAATGAICREEIAQIIEFLIDLQSQRYSGSIGVVTPFKHQMIRLRDAVEAKLSREFVDQTRLLVSTAHGFQGDERDLLLLSLSCGPGMPDGALRFVADGPNLFNVAVTRARAVLNIVGNRDWALESGVFFLQSCARLSLDGAKQLAPAADLFESPWERILAHALEAAGIRTTPQYRIAGRRLDLAVLDPIKLDIEVDGEHHRTASGGRKDDDCWRDLQMQSLGWKVCRFWVYELRDDLAGCTEKVRAMLGNNTKRPT